ncbi:MAG: flagellar export protein FliJ [Candidatus Cybelea sp.]
MEPLLEERRHREERKRQAFARAKRAREEGVRELERLNGSVREAGAALHGCALSAEFAGAGVRFYDARLRFLTGAIARQGERVTRWAGDVSAAQAELLTAHRDRLLVEKLRERRLREFRAAEARRDEMEIDEANSRLHAWRSRALRQSFDKLRMTCPSTTLRQAQDDMSFDKLRMT